MKKVVVGLILMILVVLSVPKAQAVSILDTGEIQGSGGLTIFWQPTWQYYFAAKFSLDDDYTITSLLGWFNVLNPGDLTVSVYGDAGRIPDTTDSIYSDNIFIEQTDSTQWLGLTDLNLGLNAGNYWLAFETTDINLKAAMPFGNPPNPAAGYAYYYTTTSSWKGAPSSYKTAVRIGGEKSSPVPEPATVFTLSLGMMGVFIRKNKKGVTA